MKSFTISLFFLLLSAFSFSQYSETWSIIKASEDSIYNTNTEQKLDFFYDRVNGMLDSIYVQVSNTPQENGKYRVIISANGNKKLFPRVKACVAAAPEFERFEFVALRPAENDYPGFMDPSGLNLYVQYMYFEPLKIGDEFGIAVYSYAPENEVAYNILHDNGCMVIDHLIGEEFFAEHIKFWDFYYTDDLTATNQIYPLKQLRAFTESYYKSLEK